MALSRHWPLIRVLVRGQSMAPTLYDGDQLLVRRTTSARPGIVLVASFGARPELLVVKRAVRPVPGGWWIEGDNSEGSDDSRRYGPAQPIGRVLWRYWPPLRSRS